MTRIDLKKIRYALETEASIGMSGIFENAPFSRAFHEGTSTDLQYFRRHLLETVVRMRLDIQTDAYALYKMRATDNELSKQFSRYISEESGHDDLFLADIEKFGVSRAAALATRPLQATQRLIGLFYYHINHEGPLLTILWGWFVEWYADNFNAKITRRASLEFGNDKLKGSIAHITYDTQEDHRDFMLQTVAHLVRTDEEMEKAKEILRTLTALLGDYFQELYDTTIGTRIQPKSVELGK